MAASHPENRLGVVVLLIEVLSHKVSEALEGSHFPARFECKCDESATSISRTRVDASVNWCCRVGAP
jgi:hypothetical protein